jgi:PAS domain S-box-containing protein
MLQKPSGEKIWFSGNSTPSPRENEMVFNSIIQDITDRKQAEEKLRESEEHFRNLYEEAPNAMFSVGTDGIIRRCNRRAGLLLGCPTDVLVGKPIFEIYADTPDGKVKAMRIFEQFRAGEKIIDKELKMQKADSTHVWVSLSVNPIRDASGQILESRSMVVDITDRKQAEEKLQESEKFFKEITENSSDLVIIMDKNGAIKYCSRSAERFTGYKPEELIGISALTFIHPDEVKRAVSTFGKAIRSMNSVIRDAFRIVHKDGSERYFDGLGRNLLDNPAIAGFVMNVRDITERKRVEKDLRESEEKYRNILENIEDGYFESDLAGNLTFFNSSACRILGYPREEMLGMNNRVYVDAENAKKCFRAYNGVYVTGIPQKGFEWEIIRKDGARRSLEVSISLIVRPGKKPTGFCGIVRDITERKKAEERLKETLENLRKALGTTLQVMISVVETRDPYTAGHQIRVAELARSIASEIGLSNE